MLQESVPNELPLGDNGNLCALLRVPKTMHSNKSGLMKSLWTPLTSRFLRKFPYNTVQHGTPVYTMDQRAPEWVQL